MTTPQFAGYQRRLRNPKHPVPTMRDWTYDIYDATPTDRGGPNGPKGRARQAWLNAKEEALR